MSGLTVCASAERDETAMAMATGTPNVNLNGTAKLLCVLVAGGHRDAAAAAVIAARGCASCEHARAPLANSLLEPAPALLRTPATATRRHLRHLIPAKWPDKHPAGNQMGRDALLAVAVAVARAK